MIHRLALGCLVLATALATSADASAESEAETLFQEGVELLKRNELDEACPKLERSVDLEPLSGALMTLAQCHDLQGKTATAYEEYRQASTLARLEGRTEYENKAKDLAAALEPKLSRIVVTVADAAPDLAVTLAGKRVDPATFGEATPYDPGSHPLTASAPGRQPWSTTVTLEGQGTVVTVAIPPLAQEPLPAAEAPSSPPPPSPLPPAPDEGSEGIPAWAWIAGGVGIAAAAVSAGTLAMQLSAASRLDENCGEGRQDCPAGYDFEGDHGTEKLGNGLFIGFGIAAIVGLGVGTAGIILGATADDADTAVRFEVVPLASPTMGGGQARMTF